MGQDRLTTKVSELRELQAHLEHQAFHDPLTGLANRLLFMDRVEHTLKRRQGNAVVLYVDLDDFKPINDTYGHEAGDAVLAAAADRLRASLRAADTASRLGGDEFAVLLVDIADEHIAVVVDRIIDNLVAAARVRGPRARGQGEHGRGGRQLRRGVTADELVRNADVAMYVSKHGGKGRLSHYDAQPPRPSRSGRRSSLLPDQLHAAGKCASSHGGAERRKRSTRRSLRRRLAGVRGRPAAAVRAVPEPGLAVWASWDRRPGAGSASSSRATPVWRARIRRLSAGAAKPRTIPSSALSRGRSGPRAMP